MHSDTIGTLEIRIFVDKLEGRRPRPVTLFQQRNVTLDAAKQIKRDFLAFNPEFASTAAVTWQAQCKVI